MIVIHLASRVRSTSLAPSHGRGEEEELSAAVVFSWFSLMVEERDERSARIQYLSYFFSWDSHSLEEVESCCFDRSSSHCLDELNNCCLNAFSSCRSDSIGHYCIDTSSFRCCDAMARYCTDDPGDYCSNGPSRRCFGQANCCCLQGPHSCCFEKYQQCGAPPTVKQRKKSLVRT